VHCLSVDAGPKIQALYGEALKSIEKKVDDLTPQDVWKAMYHILVQLENENAELRSQVKKLSEKIS